MTRQQVNLYLPHLHPRTDFFAPAMLLKAFVALVVVLCLVALGQWWQVRQVSEQVSDLTLRIQSEKTTLENLKASQPQSQSERLQQEIDQLRKTLSLRQELVAMLSGRSSDNIVGFSKQMLSLSQQIEDGVALEKFTLLHGGQAVTLQGIALSADRVPLYVEKLRNTSAFANSAFGPLWVQKEESDARVYRFSLNKAAFDSQQQTRQQLQQQRRSSAGVDRR